MSAPTITRDGDLITVTMPMADAKAARVLAMREAHGVVANTGQPVTRKGRSFVYTYSAVTRKAADEGVRITVTKPAVDPAIRARVGKRQTAITTGEDDRLAFLERELARVTALLLADNPTVTEIAERGATTRAAKPAKPAKARPAYVPTPEQARRAKGGHACDTCQDLGVVRGSGPRAGQAYRTAAGAAGATAPVKCPAKGCKAAKRAA